MKVSYKVLKRYIPDIASPEEVAQDLIMHTAEVEAIHSQKESFNNIVYGKITDVQEHRNANSLKVCMVDIGEETDIQIVCGGSNLEVGQGVAVAKIGASVLWHGQGDPVVMKQTAIRGVESAGMICAAEEIGLKDDFPVKDESEILDISHIEAKVGSNLGEVLGKDDTILEIDNKAINHRPDLFSHIGIAREISAIRGKKLLYEYAKEDFSQLKVLPIKNDIPQAVKRYMGIQVSKVKNIESPEYIKEVLASHNVDSKGLLVDITNYALYLYGQPSHCFDADKINGDLHIRFAKQDEHFEALNAKTYVLSPSDIVIADASSVLALGGIIGGKASAVSSNTTNIVVESAWFDQAIIRKTGKHLGLRTDALNVFEKDLVVAHRDTGPSLIIQELRKNIPELSLDSFGESYPEIEHQIKIPYSRDFIIGLIGREYSQSRIGEILDTISVCFEDKSTLLPPLWRKDLRNIADIAEEVARLDGYDNIEKTVPRINIGAVSQTNIYTAKRDIRNFLVAKGFFDLYTYSFTNKTVVAKAHGDIAACIPLKNSLSEELSHMRASLVPNLLQALEDNTREYKNLKVFECEKVFLKDATNTISEHYELSVLENMNDDMIYYKVQNTLKDLFSQLGVLSYQFSSATNMPAYAHAGRCAEVIVRGKIVGYVGEIQPKVIKNFSLAWRVGFFSLNLNMLDTALYGVIQAQEVSSFQRNNFDLNFVIDKNVEGKKIITAIQKSHALIQDVELFDIYESEEKLPGKRSLSFKIYIQSLNETLDDSIKNKLIETIIKNVEKVGGKLR